MNRHYKINMVLVLLPLQTPMKNYAEKRRGYEPRKEGQREKNQIMSCGLSMVFK